MHSPLQTDLYQLTMGAAYWKAGKADQIGVFHLFFRNLPFKSGYAIAAGLGSALEWLRDFRFLANDVDYLSSLRTANGHRLFDDGYLAYLADIHLELDIDAIPEGTPVFSYQPLLRVQGPILQAQLVETALLNILNFQTLIATKAARICRAAGGAPVLEFGYRRAQGADGGLSASRAAWIGGCAATSNVLAGKKFGIPVRGTHAHSWVMSFDDEQIAFDRFVEAMPDEAVLLVDTYETLRGVDRAIETARRLRERGFQLGGIRLDSGDLLQLSQAARQRLDAAGFGEVRIVASNELDEYEIGRLRLGGAKIDAWGVGTSLVTAADQAALGGVYKLSALQNPDGTWQDRIKVSEDRDKSTIPGRLQVRRFVCDDRFVADAIYDIDNSPNDGMVVVDPDNPACQIQMSAGAESYDLLQPVMRTGIVVCGEEPLSTARGRCLESISRLDPANLLLIDPQRYPAGIEIGLHKRRESLITSHQKKV